MQGSCPGFYYCLDLDDEGRLKNVFWADNRCREAYKEFGDVVTFDTTYLTNKYDMPFASFVGVNHHGHSTLLGCGLVSNEEIETFIWLFRTWLQCMDDEAPKGIITDQDKAMKSAIEVVFPKTRHRWCLWHIMKKLPDKFGYHDLKAPIMSAIHEVVYESQYSEEFENGWTKMIDKYILHENTWLNELYEERRRWVPCYLKTSFWAGMSTTQRSESINAFFDGYVNSKTSLKQFVEQYERALKSRVEKEFQADFKCFSQTVPCATKYELEKQFQLVYTISKFQEFQVEFTGVVYCQVISTSERILEKTYEIKEDYFYDEGLKEKYYFVSYEEEQCFGCSCHLFEFRGIICRHSLLVLKLNGVTSVPDRYILHRWRKDVSRLYQRVMSNYDGWQSTPSQLRYDKVCRAVTNVANLVVDDEDKTHELLEWLENKFSELSLLKSKPKSIDLILSEKELGADGDHAPILDPKCSKSKGAPRKLRKKGHLEKSLKKTRVQCRSKKRMNYEELNLIHEPASSQMSQQAEFPMANSMSYTQLMGAAQYQSLIQSYGGNFLPTNGMDQIWNTMFQKQVQHDQDKVVGSSTYNG